jgi:CheY-like chemotaxis protein
MAERTYILYADDDMDDREMMEHAFLAETEHNLLTFSNGEELLAHVRAGSTTDVCLIVLDINMPILNGMETLRQIKSDEALKSIPVVMFSTSGSPTDRAEAAALQTDVLLKPSSFADVLTIGKTMLTYCRRAG